MIRQTNEQMSLIETKILKIGPFMIKSTRYIDKNNQLHRIGGPAIINDDGTKYWFVNGERHREDGPACENLCSKEYWINGKYVVGATPESFKLLVDIMKLKELL